MADYSSMSDEQLVAGGLSADGGRVTELISRYSNLVFSMAKRYAAYADYEELVSDGLDALLNAISSYDEQRGSFGAFASVCISNRMKNTTDKAIRRKSRLEDESKLDSLQDSVPSPEDIVIMKESASEMSEQMKKLLSPLELRCLEGVILGRSYAEIAEKLGIERKSVDNAVARARAKLKAVFPDH